MKTRDLTKAEYGDFYAGYIEVLGNVDLLEEMRERKLEFEGLIDGLSDEQLTYRYAPGKWTIGEVILHIIDAERVFQYRALRFGRGDTVTLPGYDQDLFVESSDSEKRTLDSLKSEFLAVREASLTLFESFSDHVLGNIGVASGSEVSVRALGFMISGHQKHHEQILKQRYLNH